MATDYRGHFGAPGLLAATRAYLSRADLAKTRQYLVADHFQLSQDAYRNALSRQGPGYAQLLEDERERRLRIVLAHQKRPLHGDDLRLAFGYWQLNNALKKFEQFTGLTMTQHNRARWGRPCATAKEKKRYPPMRWGCT